MSLWKGRQKMLEALGKADATHSDSILALDRVSIDIIDIVLFFFSIVFNYCMDSLSDAKAPKRWSKERPSPR